MTMKKIISTILVCVMLVGCVFTLASCTGPNSDPDKAEASLKEAGYTVIAIPTFGIAGVKKSISATNLKDSIQIFYLNEDADLDKAYEYVENLYNEAKEKDEDIDFQIGKNSKMIWFGTSTAIKAAR